MTAKQTITVTKSTKTRGLASLNKTGGAPKKVGRPKGSKDTKPRKTRSDKGKKRGKYKPRKTVSA